MTQPSLSISTAHFILAAASLRWLAGVILAIAATLALAAEPPRKVLVVYSDNRLLPGLAVIDEALDSVLRTEYGPEIELLNEFFDLDRPRQAGYEDDLVAFLRKKYAGTQIDAIVAVRGPALKFLLQRRDQFLPGVPVVHVSISTQELAGMALPRDVIGVPVKLEPEKTIELALRLHPVARRVVVITGTSEFDRGWEALLRRAFKPLEGRAEFEFWVATPLAEILDRVRRLSADSIVYLPGFRQDGTGQRLVPQEVAALSIPVALLFFNVGVEIGQFTFIAAMFAVIGMARWIGRRIALPRLYWWWRIPPYAIGGISSYWVIERVAAF